MGGLQLGNVFVGVQPLLGLEGDPMRLMFERDLTPHPQYAAFYQWLQKEQGFGAQVRVLVYIHSRAGAAARVCAVFDFFKGGQGVWESTLLPQVLYILLVLVLHLFWVLLYFGRVECVVVVLYHIILVVESVAVILVFAVVLLLLLLLCACCVCTGLVVLSCFSNCT